MVLGDKASEKQKKSVQAMANTIVNKILHEPITTLKEQCVRGDPSSNDLLLAVQELFQLDIDDDASGSDTAAVMREAEAAEEALGDMVAIGERLQLAMSGGGKA